MKSRYCVILKNKHRHRYKYTQPHQEPWLQPGRNSTTQPGVSAQLFCQIATQQSLAPSKRNMASIKRGTFWLCFSCSGRIRRHIVRVCLCETVETERVQARYAAGVTHILAALSFAVCSSAKRYARGMAVISSAIYSGGWGGGGEVTGFDI